MPEITRRRLLTSAAGAAGSALATTMLPPALQSALAAGPRSGSVRDIEHVVILMQENRSFDHYFGTLAGVRGFGDPNAIVQSGGQSIFYQPDPVSNNPDGYLLPFHLDTTTTSSQAIPSTSHAWTVQHQAWNNGLMNDWLPAHLAADGLAHGWYTMGYYERSDIPFHFTLAENFTICDGYHCSVLGPTWPNRLYLMSANIDPEGTSGGPIISNVVPTPYTWTSYPERLTEAGVSWRVYQQEDDYGTNVLEWFAAYQNAEPGSTLYEGALTITAHDQFEIDCATGKLPTVSWIIPTSGQSEHPAYIPAAGADFVASKLEAVAANEELWSKTLFIVNYDENDGLFDHVPPPTPPTGTALEFIDGAPIGGGIRVPCILVSPWTVGGWVASESFDHTSVLQLLEQVTGVTEPNITAWRRQTFGDLTSALGFTAGRPFPELPPTMPSLIQAEQEVASLPAATEPPASQTAPVQETSRPAPSPPGWLGGVTLSGLRVTRDPATAGPLPLTASRLEETRTTHRGDFPNGTSDTVFPGMLAAVSGRAVTASSGGYAYVSGLVGGNVAVINAQTYALESAIEGVTNPFGIAATPDGSAVYVANSGTNTVGVIDTATNTITTNITVGLYPHGVTASPDGSKMYVANTGPDTGASPSPGPGGCNTVSVIEVASNTLAATFTVGLAPQVVAVSPDGSTLFVTCRDALYVLDAARGRVRATWQALGRAHGVAMSPNGEMLCVAVPHSDVVVILDSAGRERLGEVRIGVMPWNIAITADGTTAYVTNADNDTVSAIDLRRQRVEATISVGHIPTGIIAGSPYVWVANNTASTVSVIDPSTNAVVETVNLGLSDEPTGIALI
ncbi:MAG TPA: alkaline phosphatase family protein [Solirubrobacteraceae bacterium]|jgi:phospholipase C|nr:alkaline phosphatase family protein [Solirubrobacteraceae bacterium]